MKLKQNMKRMLNALAYQHAADFLPYQDKLATLGMDDKSRNTGRLLPDSGNSNQRIAWLTDGTDQSLNYTLDICNRQQAKLDLLLHGDVLSNEKSLHSLQTTIKRVGIPHQSIALQQGTIKELQDYLLQHTDLVYLIASSANPLAQLLSQKISSSENHLNIPLVLCELRQPASQFQA